MTVLAALVAATLAVAARAADGKPDRPNVLFLICDDLNCDLGCYGHPLVKSPNIDRLAARGVRFDRAYCQYPLCGPSRAAFMTGMYPDQTLVRQNAIYIREHTPNVKTVAQMFRDAGYTATRIGKIFHYNVPLHIGTSGHDDPYSWDFTFNPRGHDRYKEERIFSLVPGQYGGTLSWLADDASDSEQTDGIAAALAVEQLKQNAADGTPFYLAVGLYRPHTPYVAPKKYFDMYPLDAIKVPTLPDGYLDTIPKPAVQSIRRKKDQINLADSLARRAIQAYYASITFADAQLGIILDTLKQTGLDKNTVVLFTSDHGYHMGEHGHWQKTTLFENATRVPLIMAGPGVTAIGQTSASPAEMIDFYPTLGELCGLKPPASISGVSLLPALRSVDATPRTSALTQYANGYSIRTSTHRYTEWGDNGSLGNELYDHANDPAEMTNLAGRPESANLVDELSVLLRRRITEAKQPPKGVTQIEFENRRRVPR
ncbi:sulfatase-like hydrolase/transferase [bacterium]|nr:sulfatase-like hydrolase/transferase [bacterium]